VLWQGVAETGPRLIDATWATCCKAEVVDLALVRYPQGVGNTQINMH
jgi:hypothetical protein